MSTPTPPPSPPRIGRVRLARVAAHLDWFARRYLHPRERALAAALRIDKRRVDFIAGRVAAKRALARAADVYILPDEGPRAGVPIPRDASGTPLAESLSITHGAGWACAAARPGAPIGLDIERIEPRPASFLAEAFAPDELGLWSQALARAAADPLTVTVAWCAKEALLKRAGVGLRLALPAIAPTRITWHTTPPASDGTLAWAECTTDSAGDCSLAVQLLPARAIALVFAG
jgi:4'-phosphopantetheinyl transferase EntD